MAATRARRYIHRIFWKAVVRHDRISRWNARRLAELLGNPDLTEDEVSEARWLIVDCDALAEVEAMLTARVEQAVRVLESMPINPQVKTPLRRLVALATGKPSHVDARSRAV